MNNPRRQHLDVYLDGTLIGVVEQTPQGALSFQYDEDYRGGADPTPLSLAMPVGVRRHPQRAIANFLWGLLPDNASTLERWAAEFGVSPNSPFGLLKNIGRDAAGAVQILPADVESSDAAVRQGTVRELSAAEFHDLCLELAGRSADWNPGRFGGRWSLAGAQPKVALFRSGPGSPWAIPLDSTPTTHIIKPLPTNAELERHHINEFLCQQAARRAGLDAANIELYESGEVRAVVSVRYDRVPSAGRWVRVHQEDLCQALSVHPSRKYQEDNGPSVGKVAEVIRRLELTDRRATARSFLQGLAFNTLIGGTDAHAKNYSVMLRGRRVRLAPLYDLASAACYDQHRRLTNALRINGQRYMLDVTAKDWERVGTQLGLGRGESEAIVSDLRTQLPDAFSAAVAMVPESDRARATTMAQRIIEHVEGTCRPNLDRDPHYVLPASTADPADVGVEETLS